MNMKLRKRKQPPFGRQEATTGLAAVKGVQRDMKLLQEMLSEIGPHIKTIAALSSRIDKLEEVTGALAAEVAELKQRL